MVFLLCWSTGKVEEMVDHPKHAIDTPDFRLGNRNTTLLLNKKKERNGWCFCCVGRPGRSRKWLTTPNMR